MFHRSDALETKLDKLLESNKDLNKSLQGVTNSIEGMATSIVDALKLRTSGEQPKPNSEGQSSGKQPKPNSEGQSSDNTPPRQPTTRPNHPAMYGPNQSHRHRIARHLTGIPRMLKEVYVLLCHDLAVITCSLGRDTRLG
ncbi:hypothetical protein BT96DRAFT_1003681 [Gymnopus androsaceus JB14]|uniref:Uncharacterized protein n=1 Tax=Gymnopus androsaceus JB14 TaxID=1447944 RepID=A0A6A4GUC1_9AGAR|nr:hypothetical protein BT96DRAFT_1003681 [Gymnopus androsaceus JB14]